MKSQKDYAWKTLRVIARFCLKEPKANENFNRFKINKEDRLINLEEIVRQIRNIEAQTARET